MKRVLGGAGLLILGAVTAIIAGVQLAVIRMEEPYHMFLVWPIALGLAMMIMGIDVLRGGNPFGTP